MKQFAFAAALCVGCFLVPIAAQTYPLRTFPDLGYFKCNEGVGATVNNTAFPGTGPGSYVFPTPGATPWVVPGKVGASALAIATVIGGMGTPLNSGVSPNWAGSFTIELWIRPEGPNQNGIVSDATAGAFTVAWPTTATTGGSLQWRGAGTGATNEYVNFTYSPIVGTWSHVALVQDIGLGQRRAYVNGVLAGTATFNPPPAGYPAATGLVFGGTGIQTDWSLDEIRVWNKLRTVAEIAANQNIELADTNKLTLSQSAPLVGDVTITLANVSATADNGWTLLSADISAAGNTGPVFGIRPDATTWLVFATFAQAIGNPFHFPVPGSGFYPDIPFGAPAGSVSSLIGQTWDFVAVMTTLGGFNSVSNVVRFNFQ